MARPNPFVGLRPFEREEAVLFFGRDEQTLELLERLHAKRFLAVVGSSGCGKSSLVRAGLLSKLQASTAMSDRWRVVTMKPGSRPCVELAAALSDSAGIDVPAFAETLRTGGLTPLLDAIAPAFARGDASLLLVVDQFEELFRFGLQNGDEARREEAAEFVALLLSLARQTSFPVYVVITLRSDFLGDCDAFHGLPEALNESQYLVPRLPRGKRQEAIEGPVRLYGKSIAPRLVDRLLNDGGAAPDQLPILQHTLMRLWDAAGEARELDIAHYEAVGGLAEALSKHAREALKGLEPDELAVAEKLFRALITTDANNRQIRRPRTLAQLVEEIGVEHGQLVRVIDIFRGYGLSFLMPPPGIGLAGDTLVDISHESLIRQWETLRGWVEAESVEATFKLAKVFEEKAESVLKTHDDDMPQKYPKAWLFNLVALSQRVGERHLSMAMGWLLAPDLRNGAFREVWRSPWPPGAIYVVAFSPDGRRLASGSEDGTIRVWDMSMGQSVATLQGHSAGVWSVAFSPDGRRLASGSLDGTIRVWDVSTCQSVATLQGDSAGVWSVAFSPDGRRLASGFLDGTIRIWDVSTTQSVATLEGHLVAVRSVAFSPDGRLASGSLDGTIRIWDVSTTQSVATLEGHSAAVRSAAFSPDGRRLASGSLDRTIRIWDVSTTQSVATLQGHSSGVLGLTFSPDGRRLASGSSDETIRVWDVLTGQSVETLYGHSAPIRSVAFSPDGRCLASGSEDQTFRLWDVSTDQSVAMLQGHSASVLSVAFSLDGCCLASGSEDGTIQVWNVSTGQSVATLYGHSAGVSSVAFSPDGRCLASGSSDETIHVWDVLTGQSAATLQGHSAGILSVAFSPDGRHLASGSLDRTISLWDVLTGQSVATLQGHSAGVLSVAFSPDGRRLASGSSDQTIRVWDMSTGQCVATLQGHSAPVRSVAFSPDGRRLASGSSDQTIRAWDVSTGQSLATLQGHSSAVRSVSFSPDGRRLASGSYDQKIRVWEVSTGQSLATLQGHSDQVLSVAFSPDGRHLASGSEDGTIRRWFASFPEALASPKTRTEAFEKIYRASLHFLRYRPNELDFEPLPDQIGPMPREIPAIYRPRPLDKDLLEWLLEAGENLPETPQ